jgi:hypothetical protein
MTAIRFAPWKRCTRTQKRSLQQAFSFHAHCTATHQPRRVHMKTDLDKALEIVMRHGSFVGRGGTMRESIALAVAEGIALGR